MISQAELEKTTPSGVSWSASVRCSNSSAVRLRRVVEVGGEPACDAERRHERVGVVGVLAEAHRLGERREVDVVVAGGPESLRRDPLISEAERAGHSGRRRGEVAPGRERGAHRVDPLVGGELAPAGQHERRAGPQRAPDVRERGDRIGEEHRAERADGDVERIGLERVHLGVGLLEADVVELLGLGCGPSDGEHPRRQVDPERGPLDGDATGAERRSRRCRSRRRGPRCQHGARRLRAAPARSAATSPRSGRRARPSGRPRARPTPPPSLRSPYPSPRCSLPFAASFACREDILYFGGNQWRTISRPPRTRSSGCSRCGAGRATSSPSR